MLVQNFYIELRITTILNTTTVIWTHDCQEFGKANFKLNRGLRRVWSEQFELKLSIFRCLTRSITWTQYNQEREHTKTVNWIRDYQEFDKDNFNLNSRLRRTWSEKLELELRITNCLITWPWDYKAFYKANFNMNMVLRRIWSEQLKRDLRITNCLITWKVFWTRDYQESDKGNFNLNLGLSSAWSELYPELRVSKSLNTVTVIRTQDYRTFDQSNWNWNWGL